MIKTKAKQKQKYRGMFETQKSRNKTSSGDIGLNIRTLASPKVGQDQVSGGVSVLCWHAAPVANVIYGNISQLGKKSNSVIRCVKTYIKTFARVAMLRPSWSELRSKD